MSENSFKKNPGTCMQATLPLLTFGRAGIKPISVARENSFLGKVFGVFNMYVTLPLIRLIWLRKVSGAENLPAGAFILAANHQSALDIPALFGAADRLIHFLAAGKFFRGFFPRALMEYTGQIKIDYDLKDKSSVFEKGLGVLSSGRVLGIFPEGQRSENGRIGSAFTGVARFALLSRAPVVPAGVCGARELLPIGRILPGFKKSVEVAFGAPVDLSEFYGQELTPEILRAATDRIMGEVARLAGEENR